MSWQTEGSSAKDKSTEVIIRMTQTKLTDMSSRCSWHIMLKPTAALNLSCCNDMQPEITYQQQLL